MAKLKVFITIDTEVWPLLADWRQHGLARDIRRDLYGETPQGQFGLTYQLKLLSRFGLKGVFFVESLFADVAGKEALAAVINEIQDNEQEVQAHLHPEWLGWMSHPPLERVAERGYLKDYSETEQKILIDKVLENLRTCGARNVCAFRAGDYAANTATLRALASRGITYDTSCNPGFRTEQSRMDGFPFLLQPFRQENVHEFPVSFFSDLPGHYRHAEICACSSGEMQTALLKAWQKGWNSFVLVSHSFELLKRRRTNPQCPRPDWTVVRRFEDLCHFLASNPDKFETSGFAELSPGSFVGEPVDGMLRTKPHQTMWRWIEQTIRRVM